MTSEPEGPATDTRSGNSRLAMLLAMAMFVLVVDTSIMNVSITAVAEDLDTSVSSVQSAIALEALVSAAASRASTPFGAARLSPEGTVPEPARWRD